MLFLRATSCYSKTAAWSQTAFYRDKLKAMSEGKQLMDMASPEGAMLGLVDDKAKSTIQVHIGKADTRGSSIMISSSRGKQ